MEQVIRKFKEGNVGSFVYCPNNKNGTRVALDVCLQTCSQVWQCKEIAEVSRADLEAAAKKAGIPLSRLDELERTVRVDS